MIALITAASDALPRPSLGVTDEQRREGLAAGGIDQRLVLFSGPGNSRHQGRMATGRAGPANWRVSAATGTGQHQQGSVQRSGQIVMEHRRV